MDVDLLDAMVLSTAGDEARVAAGVLGLTPAEAHGLAVAGAWLGFGAYGPSAPPKSGERRGMTLRQLCAFCARYKKCGAGVWKQAVTALGRASEQAGGCSVAKLTRILNREVDQMVRKRTKI